MSNFSSTDRTSSTDELTFGVKITFILLMTILFIVSVISNTLVLVTIFGTRKLRNATSGLLANLAVCDLLASVFMMPTIVTSVMKHEWEHGEVSCDVVGVCTMVLLNSSIYTVTAVAFDRFMAIVHCLKYSSWSQQKYIGLLIAGLWTLSILNNLPPTLIGWSSVKYRLEFYMCFSVFKPVSAYGIYYVIMVFLLPFLIMSCCYGVIVHVARSHARKIGDINSQLQKNSQGHNVPTNGLIALAVIDPVRRFSLMGMPNVIHNNTWIDSDLLSIHSQMSNTAYDSRKHRESIAMLRLLGLVVVFLISWALFVGALIHVDYGRDVLVYPEFVQTVGCLLVGLHLALNPYLYALFSKQFRLALAKLLRCKMCEGDVVTKVQNTHHSQYFKNKGRGRSSTFNTTHRQADVLSVTTLDNHADACASNGKHATEAVFSTSGSRREPSIHLNVPYNPQEPVVHVGNSVQVLTNKLGAKGAELHFSKNPLGFLPSISSNDGTPEKTTTAKVTVQIKLELV